MAEEKKALYHSKAGKVDCTVKSDVLESKWKKGTYYVVLIIDGGERNYVVENEACANVLKCLKGKSVTLEFLGSRDDATISVVGGVAPSSAPKPQEQRQNAARPQPGANSGRPIAAAKSKDAKNEAADIAEAKRRQVQLGNLFEISLDLATIIAIRWNEKNKANQSLRPMTTEDIRHIASGLQIGGEKQGNFTLMPEHLMTPAVPKGGAK